MENSLAYFISVLKKDFVDFSYKKLQALELTQSLLFILIYIGKAPNCSAASLAKDLYLDIAHVSRSLEKLVQQELISRVKNPQDKRACILNLTTKGQEAMQLSYDLFKEWDTEILQSLNEHEKASLFNLLQKIKRG